MKIFMFIKIFSRGSSPIANAFQSIYFKNFFKAFVNLSKPLVEFNLPANTIRFSFWEIYLIYQYLINDLKIIIMIFIYSIKNFSSTKNLQNKFFANI